MVTGRKNPKVDEYLSKAKKWNDEYVKLRNSALKCHFRSYFAPVLSVILHYK